MTILSARYGFKEPRSRFIQRPDDPLYKAFEKWLKDVPDFLEYFEKKQEEQYQRALNLVEKVAGIKEKTASEIQTVLLQYQTDPRIRNAGLFLSACYNLIDQKDLVWDLDIDTKVNLIGYMLNKGKRLVLKADSGDDIGTYSNGLLVNYAYVRGSMASGAEAPAVNFGSVGRSMASVANGNAVNFGTVGWMTSSGANGNAVNFGTVKHSMAFCAEAPAVNFGSVGGDMASFEKAPSVNFGSVGEYMALGAEASSINFGSVGRDMNTSLKIHANIAIKNPDGKFWRYGEICLDESEARQHPRLVKYFEDFKAEGEKYRQAGFPECLGVFDVVEQFIGSGTGEELNKQFMQKLRGLVDSRTRRFSRFLGLEERFYGHS